MVSAVVAPRPSMNMPSDPPPELDGRETCPSCHTEHPRMTKLVGTAGADWQCARCGSRWDAARLAAVAAYAVWLSEHDERGAQR